MPRSKHVSSQKNWSRVHSSGVRRLMAMSGTRNGDNRSRSVCDDEGRCVNERNDNCQYGVTRREKRKRLAWATASHQVSLGSRELMKNSTSLPWSELPSGLTNLQLIISKLGTGFGLGRGLGWLMCMNKNEWRYPLPRNCRAIRPICPDNRYCHRIQTRHWCIQGLRTAIGTTGSSCFCVWLCAWICVDLPHTHVYVCVCVYVLC